jgi:signal transduction histidine kinase/ActR/RegA family two-component response regulator
MDQEAWGPPSEDSKRTEGANTSETRLASIVEQLPISVGLADAHGRMVLTNAFMKHHALHTIPSRDPERIKRWHAQRADGTVIEPSQWPGARALRGETVSPGIQFRYVNDEGVEEWLSVAASPLRSPEGNIEGALVVMQDITAQKRAELALKEVDRRKDVFLATLAHELRNPLAAISSALDILSLRGSPDPVSQSTQQTMHRQLRHTVQLLDDLMDVSRITHGKLTIQRRRVSVAQVLDQAIETSRPNLKHELVVSMPVHDIWMDVDRDRIAQVFSNLLNNAFRYTPEGARVTVRGKQQGDWAVVTVEDSGRGIAEEDIPRLFDLFYQAASSPEESRQGVGIGLSLARSLVELHGGTIAARSAGLGKGSEFSVRLPLSEQKEELEAKPRPMASIALRQVLVADDDPDVAAMLGTLLEMHGAEVHMAHDGAETIKKAEMIRPELIFLDLGMPVLDGYAACRAIRQRDWGNDIKIIALTGRGQEDDRRKSAESGFDAHLVKPVDIDTLVDTVNRVRTTGA